MANFLKILFFWILTLSTSLSVMAFTTHPEGDNNTPDIVWDDLLDANRWSMIEGTLVDDGVRGLDGGIEYAISSTFCHEISHHFFGYPQPTCAELRAMIKRAFDAWAEGNPNLRFVDVSDRIETVLHSRYGAEIDFFALTSEEFPQMRTFSAITRWWWDPVEPMSSTGKRLPGRSLKAADIIFSVENRNCYYHDIDPVLIECNHFQSLVMHEIGHALGLYHPDQMPDRNFDQDNNPRNEPDINCDNPSRGFEISFNYDPAAVMNARLKVATPRLEGLMPDDIAGRDFLYPICDLSEIAAVSSSNIISDLRWGGELFLVMALVGIVFRIRRYFSVQQY